MSIGDMNDNLLARLGAGRGEKVIAAKQQHRVMKQSIAASLGSVMHQETVNVELPASSSAADRGIDKTERMHEWVRKNRNPNTRKAYESGWRGFEHYMKMEMGVEKVTNASLEALQPCDVADYLRLRHERDGVAAATLAGDRAAIANKLKYTGNSVLHMAPLIADTLKLCMNMAAQSKPKTHMSAELMRDIVSDNDSSVARPLASPYNWVMERNTFMMLLMMVGMLRESEVVELQCEDVETEREGLKNGLALYPSEALVRSASVPLAWTPFAVYNIVAMRLHIRSSKTDQAKKGAYVMISANNEEPSMCPIRRLARYQRVCVRAHVVSTFLFPTATGAGMARSTPCGIVQAAVRSANARAFEKSNWHKTLGALNIPRDEWARECLTIQEGAAEHWGSPDSYGSHSMRRGGVTEARKAGIDMLEIQKHGRWISNAVWGYVGTSKEEKMKVTKNIFGSGAATSGQATTCRTNVAQSREAISLPPLPVSTYESVVVAASIVAPGPTSAPTTPLRRSRPRERTPASASARKPHTSLSSGTGRGAKKKKRLAFGDAEMTIEEMQLEESYQDDNTGMAPVREASDGEDEDDEKYVERGKSTKATKEIGDIVVRRSGRNAR